MSTPVVALVAAAAIAFSSPALAMHENHKEPVDQSEDAEVQSEWDATQGEYNANLIVCAHLYIARNDIFHKKGLKFDRPTALKLYGEGGHFATSAEMQRFHPLTRSELQKVESIRSKEKTLSCPRF